MKFILIAIIISSSFFQSIAQPYKNPDLPVEERVKDLLGRMTQNEKFWQLFMIPGDLGDDASKYKSGIFGFQVNTVAKNSETAQQLLTYGSGSNAYETAKKINEIQRYFVEETRLGIPVIFFDEALHGLVRDGATAFPQAIGLAATWNIELMSMVANAIAQECKSRGIRQVLSPVVNIASDVRWGRTEETYGEDPFLVSEMGVAYVSAFEQLGIITTPKHFIANVGEGGRDSYPIHWNERFMREMHLPPFDACIKRGGSRSVMTSYNSFDGLPCTANDWLLFDLLKKEWNFKGFVISDAGATGGANVLHMTASDYPDATAKSIIAGLDVIFQTSYDHNALFSPPFFDGSIDQKVVDEAVARVLRAKFELGLFENPYVYPELANDWNGNATHRALALKAARQSIVLLKNEGNVLPLTKGISSIAVIGPEATEARLGGYSGAGNDKVSILDGIKKKAGNTIAVNYEKGCSRESQDLVAVPSSSLICNHRGESKNGLLGRYYNNIELKGEPVFSRIDETIQFQWTLFSPDPKLLNYDFYSVSWEGKIRSPESGEFKIGIDGNDGYRLYVDNKLLIDNWVKRTRQVKAADFSFIKDREYDIRIEFFEPTGNAWFNLVWSVGTKNEDKSIQKAVEVANMCDISIVTVGITEGEFQDRAKLSLPGRQVELINRIAQTDKPVVLVIVGGSAVTMEDWFDDVDGILMAWYPGEEGGNAIADVLFGDYNPAGRLPITFPLFEGQLPLVYNHKPTGRGDDYVNLTGQPLFPFGYGLSYSTFSYSNIKLDKEVIGLNDTAKVYVTIQNTGEFRGDEVIQLYIRDELASVARPVMELKGFQRITLNPGESRDVVFTIYPSMLSMLDKDMKRIVEPGDFRILIGASSKDIRERKVLRVEN